MWQLEEGEEAEEREEEEGRKRGNVLITKSAYFNFEHASSHLCFQWVVFFSIIEIIYNLLPYLSSAEIV